jgi:hypothetical protein
VTVCQQPIGQVAADESGRAGDETPHLNLTPAWRR